MDIYIYINIWCSGWRLYTPTPLIWDVLIQPQTYILTNDLPLIIEISASAKTEDHDIYQHRYKLWYVDILKIGHPHCNNNTILRQIAILSLQSPRVQCVKHQQERFRENLKDRHRGQYSNASLTDWMERTTKDRFLEKQCSYAWKRGIWCAIVSLHWVPVNTSSWFKRIYASHNVCKMKHDKYVISTALNLRHR